MQNLKTIISARAINRASQTLARHITSKDPGIGARKKLIMSTTTDLEHETTDFEDVEADFMEVHKSHKDHMREMELQNEKLKYHIVKEKYFKVKFPNFLTWHDKEQIRYLHRTDPDEWTIEKLAEGFPALPQTIKKIVKSNWVKTKESKIRNHDLSVQENWTLFKKGQMAELPPDLTEHLNKFTNRALNLKPFVSPESHKTAIQVKNNIGTEFSDIIKSYEKIMAKNSESEEQSIPEHPMKNSYTISKRSSTRNVTLGQLQDNLKKKIKAGKNIDEDDKIIVLNLESQESKQVEEKRSDELHEILENKYESSSSVQIYKKSERDNSHLQYPEKIRIPRNIFKRGFTYKLNDCYYDDDGEFLYRVPGMS